MFPNQYGSEWVNSYFLEVKRYIEEKSSIVQFVNPEAWKWYSIGYEVIMEE